MKHIIRRIILILVLLFVVLMSACSGTNEVVMPEKTVEKEATEPVNFQVTDLAINPVEVNLGVEVITTAKVTNTSDTEADYVAEVRIDDINRGSLPAFRYSKQVTIAASDTQLVSVLVNTNKPGTYKVTWAGLTGVFRVVQPAEETESSNPKSNASEPVIAPDFTALDVVTNETISLSQFNGSVIILNFVNYGCSPSLNKVVSAQLLAIREVRQRRDDFVPISIFCGCCPIDALREFATQNKLTWPWILDTDYSIIGKYANYLRQYGYPTLIFIDEDQHIREVTGYADVPSLSTKIDEMSQ